MNSRLALSLILAAVPIESALADGPIGDSPSYMSTAARSDVLAELASFKRSGPNPWAAGYDQLRASKSSRSRPEVAAEYVTLREEVRARTGEDGGSGYFIGNGMRQQDQRRFARAPRDAR
ncbi:hypothetical protein WG922_02750 [Ramlibacter sp. AN1015]|uniref:hypothetical protein n=1 Tax=Ramlibacter sp. AN1015 TaxID=3133428 RepID=UPI0030BD3545